MTQEKVEDRTLEIIENKEDTQALKESLRKRAVMKGIDSFGAWEEREESSIEIVNKIRASKGRICA